ALERERFDRLRKARQSGRRRTGIDRVDIGAPGLQLFAAWIARPGIVGNVVDRAAERINFEHRLTLRRRQNAHATVERTAGSALGGLRSVHLHASWFLRRIGAAANAP